MAADSASVIWVVIFAATVILAGLAEVWAWSLDRKRNYLLLMAAGTVAYAFGLWVQFAAVLPGIVLDLLLGALAMVLGAALSMEAVAHRNRRSLGYLTVAAAIAVTMAGEVWFGVIHPDTVARVRVEDYVVAALLIGGSFRAGLLGGGRRGDRTLFCGLVAIGIYCLARTWLGVSTEAFEDGADFSTELFVAPVYAIFAVLILPVAATVVSQEVYAVIELLRRERDTDSLTGVLNRGGFMFEAQRMIEDRASAPVTLVLCDLDHFKGVNDQFGHQAGDEVLREFGRLLRESARNLDLVGRVGGEEFAIMLATSSCRQGFEFAERIRHRLSSERFTSIPASHRVTASFGIAGATERIDLEDLLREADQRMYRAKAAGRDQTWPAE